MTTEQGWVSKSTGRGRAHYLVEGRPACEGLSFRGRDWVAKFTCGFVERNTHDHLCPWCVQQCGDAGIPVPVCQCGRCTADRASQAARARRLAGVSFPILLADGSPNVAELEQLLRKG